MQVINSLRPFLWACMLLYGISHICGFSSMYTSDVMWSTFLLVVFRVAAGNLRSEMAGVERHQHVSGLQAADFMALMLRLASKLIFKNNLVMWQLVQQEGMQSQVRFNACDVH